MQLEDLALTNLFLYFLLIGVIEENATSQKFVESNDEIAFVAVLTKSGYSVSNPIHQLWRNFSLNSVYNVVVSHVN